MISQPRTRGVLRPCRLLPSRSLPRCSRSKAIRIRSFIRSRPLRPLEWWSKSKTASLRWTADPRAQVNNPEIMTLTRCREPGANLGEKGGVTEVNLGRKSETGPRKSTRGRDRLRRRAELDMLSRPNSPREYQGQFPRRMRPVVRLRGPRDDVSQIIRIAEDISKVTRDHGRRRETSCARQGHGSFADKLRELGFDFSTSMAKTCRLERERVDLRRCNGGSAAERK